ELADASSGLSNCEHSCRRVPGIEVELPKTVESSCCYAAQVQRRGTRPSHPVGSQCNLVIKVDIRILVAFVAGKARRNEAFGEIGRPRDRDRLIVQGGSSSRLGHKHLLARRIVYDTFCPPSFVPAPQRN